MSRPVTVYKPGRDVSVGDILPLGPGGFLILGFAEGGPDRRLALNAWTEAIVVFDDRPTAVLGAGK